jgi:hypothetical protein
MSMMVHLPVCGHRVDSEVMRRAEERPNTTKWWLLGEQVIVVHAQSSAPAGDSLKDRSGALGCAVAH